MKGIDYDVLGFPIFKGDDVKFTTKLREALLIARDTDQFKSCTNALKKEIEDGKISKEIFSLLQLEQIFDGQPRIDGLVWHHHQVTGRYNWLTQIHMVSIT
ncbi:HNH endonuclease [Paenibacillus sp. 102]|uniref:HNH endonuclease n=1 Tax=Paenibacillus sp. 102 TaxID=3120823 RepID=UPI0031BA3834